MFGFKTKEDKDKIRIAEKLLDDYYKRKKVMELMNIKVSNMIQANPKLERLRCINPGRAVVDGHLISYFGEALFFKLLENIENGNIDVTKIK